MPFQAPHDISTTPKSQSPFNYTSQTIKSLAYQVSKQLHEDYLLPDVKTLLSHLLEHSIRLLHPQSIVVLIDHNAELRCEFHQCQHPLPLTEWLSPSFLLEQSSSTNTTDVSLIELILAISQICTLQTLFSKCCATTTQQSSTSIEQSISEHPYVHSLQWYMLSIHDEENDRIQNNQTNSHARNVFNTPQAATHLPLKTTTTEQLSSATHSCDSNDNHPSLRLHLDISPVPNFSHTPQWFPTPLPVNMINGSEDNMNNESSASSTNIKDNTNSVIFHLSGIFWNRPLRKTQFLNDLGSSRLRQDVFELIDRYGILWPHLPIELWEITEHNQQFFSPASLLCPFDLSLAVKYRPVALHCTNPPFHSAPPSVYVACADCISAQQRQHSMKFQGQSLVTMQWPDDMAQNACARGKSPIFLPFVKKMFTSNFSQVSICLYNISTRDTTALSAPKSARSFENTTPGLQSQDYAFPYLGHLYSSLHSNPESHFPSFRLLDMIVTRPIAQQQNVKAQDTIQNLPTLNILSTQSSLIVDSHLFPWSEMSRNIPLTVQMRQVLARELAHFFVYPTRSINAQSQSQLKSSSFRSTTPSPSFDRMNRVRSHQQKSPKSMKSLGTIRIGVVVSLLVYWEMIYRECQTIYMHLTQISQSSTSKNASINSSSLESCLSDSVGENGATSSSYADGVLESSSSSTPLIRLASDSKLSIILHLGHSYQSSSITPTPTTTTTTPIATNHIPSTQIETHRLLLEQYFHTSKSFLHVHRSALVLKVMYCLIGFLTLKIQQVSTLFQSICEHLQSDIFVSNKTQFLEPNSTNSFLDLFPIELSYTQWKIAHSSVVQSGSVETDRDPPSKPSTPQLSPQSPLSSFNSPLPLHTVNQKPSFESTPFFSPQETTIVSSSHLKTNSSQKSTYTTPCHTYIDATSVLFPNASHTPPKQPPPQLSSRHFKRQENNFQTPLNSRYLPLFAKICPPAHSTTSTSDPNFQISSQSHSSPSKSMQCEDYIASIRRSLQSPLVPFPKSFSLASNCHPSHQIDPQGMQSSAVRSVRRSLYKRSASTHTAMPMAPAVSYHTSWSQLPVQRISPSFLKSMIPLCQIDQRFLCLVGLSNDRGQGLTMILLDQHGVDERIRYESLLEQYYREITLPSMSSLSQRVEHTKDQIQIPHHSIENIVQSPLHSTYSSRSQHRSVSSPHVSTTIIKTQQLSLNSHLSNISSQNGTKRIKLNTSTHSRDSSCSSDKSFVWMKDNPVHHARPSNTLSYFSTLLFSLSLSCTASLFLSQHEIIHRSTRDRLTMLLQDKLPQHIIKYVISSSSSSSSLSHHRRPVMPVFSCWDIPPNIISDIIAISRQSQHHQRKLTKWLDLAIYRNYQITPDSLFVQVTPSEQVALDTHTHQLLQLGFTWTPLSTHHQDSNPNKPKSHFQSTNLLLLTRLPFLFGSYPLTSDHFKQLLLHFSHLTRYPIPPVTLSAGHSSAHQYSHPPSDHQQPLQLSSPSYPSCLTILRHVPRCISNLIASASCRGALMFGQTICRNTLFQLVNRLRNCALPFVCAHGRITGVIFESQVQMKLKSAHYVQQFSTSNHPAVQHFFTSHHLNFLSELDKQRPQACIQSAPPHHSTFMQCSDVAVCQYWQHQLWNKLRHGNDPDSITQQYSRLQQPEQTIHMSIGKHVTPSFWVNCPVEIKVPNHSPSNIESHGNTSLEQSSIRVICHKKGSQEQPSQNNTNQQKLLTQVILNSFESLLASNGLSSRVD